MCEHQAGKFWNADLVVILLRLCIRYCKKQQWRTLLCFPHAFHGCDLLRLVFECIESMKIAHQNLYRYKQCSPVHGCFHCLSDTGSFVIAKQPVGRQAGDQETGGKSRGNHHMCEAIRHRGVKDDFHPVGHMGLSINHFEPCRGMHP